MTVLIVRCLLSHCDMARLSHNRPEHAVSTAPTLSDAQIQILQQAEAARVDALARFYTPAGNTPDAGFDCSGFVIYVFNQTFGANALPDVTAEQLRLGGRFSVVTSPARAGDLVFFAASAGGAIASHVGIVIDSTCWIRSQSSTGVECVQFTNPYWQPRILSYGRYAGLQRADAIVPSSAGSFASPIRTGTSPFVARIVR